MAQISKIRFSQLSEYFGRIDAEFYKPVSLFADKIIKRQNYRNLGSLVSDGYRVVYESTKILKPEQVNLENDARFLQATNISNNGLWIDVEDIGYVSVKDWQRYPKGRIKIGEVLIEVKGQAEKVTIVQEYMPERTLITGSVFKLTLKPSTISHEYLFAFFSSSFGKVLRDRTKVNTLIAYVSKPELYRIPIPLLDNEAHSRISNFVKDSFAKQILSKDLYRQANQLLNEALGLNKIQFKREKSYQASFSEIITNNRADADFFQTKYKQIAAHLDTIETLNLGSICQFKKGIEVGTAEYKDEGFLFIRVSNITRDGISTGNADKFISNQTYYKLVSFQPNAGDILLTKDGTIGTCYVLDEVVRGIISSGIINLTLLNPDIPKEYLALVINSKICQMQAQRDCSGALILHWKPEDVRKLRIPILAPELMEEIAGMATNAKSASRQSKLLLEQAKNELETLIEQAASQA